MIETLPERTKTPIREKTTKDIFYAAALYIEEHGWVQHQLHARDGRVCAAGAILAVTGNDGHRHTAWSNDGTEAVFEFGSYLRQQQQMKRSWLDHQLGRNRPFIGVPKWNDAPGRTQDEVVAALKDAAKKETRVV